MVEPRAAFIILICLLLAAALFSMAVGSVSLPVLEVARILVNMESEPIARTIVLDIRLPRILLAVLVGGGTATAGAVIQGLFRNPLADPALIGVSSGAALFAAGFLVFGVETKWAASLGVPGSAFIGGLIATWLVLEVGRRGGTMSSMLLAGIAINAIAIAGVGLFSYLSTDVQLRSVAFWALGSFNGADWSAVMIAAVIPVVVLLLFRESRNLNAITLGDQEAGHLGISVSRLRKRAIAYTALVVGIGVSLTGVIAFVGLVVPHLVRMTMGSNHYVVIPGSAALGSILLLLADSLSRYLLAPAELPIGILTSLLGGPFFIYLIVQQKGKLGI
ncbi:MAG: iron ABC transporter permease [Pseudomonadales bacterium]